MLRALALLVVGITPASAFAFECTHSRDDCSVSIWWPSREIRFNVVWPEDAPIDRKAAERAIDAATARWNGIACSDIRLERTEEPSPNRIELVTEGWQRSRSASPAKTNISHRSSTGAIESGRIEINAEVVGIAGSGCSEVYDLETIVTHELGHLLGIAHPCETEATYPDEPACPPARCEDQTDERQSTMWPVIKPCDRELATLEVDDVVALCSIYPLAAPTRQCADLSEGSRATGCSSTGREPALWLLLPLWFILRRAR